MENEEILELQSVADEAFEEVLEEAVAALEVEEAPKKKRRSKKKAEEPIIEEVSAQEELLAVEEEVAPPAPVAIEEPEPEPEPEVEMVFVPDPALEEKIEFKPEASSPSRAENLWLHGARKLRYRRQNRIR